MDEREIRKSWRKLIIPFVSGLIILITAILFHRLGSKRPGPQTLWIFAGVLGAIFTLFPGIKMIKFRQYLKDRNNPENIDDELTRDSVV